MSETRTDVTFFTKTSDARGLGPIMLSPGEADELAAALLRPPPHAVRIRSGDDPAQLPFATLPVPWCSRGRIAPDERRPAGHLAFAAGDYFVQDAGSLLAVTLLDAQPGETVCDLCAAPGGKSTAILDTLGAGWLLANETIRSRVPALELNLARHGLPRYVVSSLDPDQLAEQFPGRFDAVLVDAPCSGQTLVGRGKQSASAFSPAQIAHSAARQARILEAARKLVRPGGRLVYSTCTLAYEENEARVAALLAERSEWRIRPCDALRPWESPALAGTYRLWPHRDGCAGAFAACVQHDAAESETPQRIRRRSFESRPITEADSWGDLSNARHVTTPHRDIAWPEDVPDDLLDAAIGGPEFAFRTGTTWSPSFALALRRDPEWHPARLEPLSTAEAIQYLQGLTLPRTERGWAIATCDGHRLGWVKGDGRHAKNRLPKPARMTLASRKA